MIKEKKGYDPVPNKYSQKHVPAAKPLTPLLQKKIATIKYLN